MPVSCRFAASRKEGMIVRPSVDLSTQNLHRRKVLALGFPSSHRLPDSAKYLWSISVIYLRNWSFPVAKTTPNTRRSVAVIITSMHHHTPRRQNTMYTLHDHRIAFPCMWRSHPLPSESLGVPTSASPHGTKKVPKRCQKGSILGRGPNVQRMPKTRSYQVPATTTE